MKGSGRRQERKSSSSTHLNQRSSSSLSLLLIYVWGRWLRSLLLAYSPESRQRLLCPRALQTTPCKNSRALGPALELESLGDTGEQWVAQIYCILFSPDDLKLICRLNSMCSSVSEHMVLYQCALELAWALQQYLSTQGTKLQCTDETTGQLILCLL